MKTPCHDCQHRGCGKQASCASYMAYWNEKQRVYRDRRDLSILNGYTKEAIFKAKSGAHSTLKKYRPKGVGT